MKIQEVARTLEQLAPRSLAEDYDNVGLLVGEPHTPVAKILVSLDMTEPVVEEARDRGAQMIVSHHPIWFGPRKNLTGQDYVSRTIMAAIRGGIGLYAIHTNLDNVSEGVNRKICDLLHLLNPRILQPKTGTVFRLEVYGRTPEALWEAKDQLEPYVRQAALQEFWGLWTFPFHARHEVERRLEPLSDRLSFFMHPVENATDFQYGAGMIGELPSPVPRRAFMKHVKEVFGCGVIRYADAPLMEEVSTVAVCGGAGSFLIQAARGAGAHAFLTGDLTYHKFFDGEGEMLLMDIGHYESEQYTVDLLVKYLKKVLPKEISVLAADTPTNPVAYFV